MLTKKFVDIYIALAYNTYKLKPPKYLPMDGYLRKYGNPFHKIPINNQKKETTDAFITG